MFRIYHIVESPLLTQLLVCLFSSWNLFSSRCRLVYKVTQFQVFLFLKLDFDVMIISKFMFRKNQLYSWWNLNVITLPGWMRMKTKKNNCLWWRCIQRHLALILLLYFWSKGDILSQAPSHFPSRSFTLTAIICLNSRTNCSKANNLFKPLSPYMKYGRQIVLSFQLKLSTQKKKINGASNIIRLSHPMYRYFL